MESKRLGAVGQQIDRHLLHLLHPGGEIDNKVRKPVTEWLSSPVILFGEGLRVKTTMAAWLTLATKAHEAGWSKGPGEQTVTAADARQFATALAKADLEEKWQKLVAAVQLLANAGGFKVYEPRSVDS